MLTPALLNDQLKGKTTVSNSNFNIQFVNGSGSIVDQNFNFYAEDDATGVNIWDEDECIATLISDGDVWLVTDLFGWWALADDLMGKEYAKVSDFVDALNEVLETV